MFSAIVVICCEIKMNEPIYPYNNFKKISTLEKKEYDSILSVVKGVAGSSHTYSTEEMKQKGIVECMRYNDGHYYSITPLSDGRYLLVLFRIWKDVYPETENTFMIVTDYYFASKLCERKKFDEEIKIGKPMEEVLVLDPNAESWERTVNSVTDYYSCHRFDDGSMVYVYYTMDKEMQKPIVESFRDGDTQNSVLSYILDRDLELLTKE